MGNDFAVPQRTRTWLTDGVLEPSYHAYLTERRYSSWTVRKYSCSVAHFAYWLRKRRVKLSQIDEALIRYFLDEHLTRCDCPMRTPRSRNHVEYALKPPGVIVVVASELSYQEESEVQVEDETNVFC